MDEIFARRSRLGQIGRGGPEKKSGGEEADHDLQGS
jgi:hypothetical protein